VSTVCAIVIVAFSIAALMVGIRSDILVVAQQICQWIELRVGHDGPLALLRVQHLRGGCDGHFI
jgi:uncharacterized membrane protein